MSREPGEDCPRCGQALGESGCLSCYWQPTRVADSGSGCRRCAEVAVEMRVKAEERAAYGSPQHCARCGQHSPSTMQFHPTDAASDPQDRGVPLCPSCWVPALRRRAARDPISDEERARCMATIRRACAAIEARRVPR